MEEMTRDQGILAARGSASQQDIPNDQYTTTLDYSKGRKIQKVTFEDQKREQMLFLRSGLTAVMEDETVSQTMMDKAVPLIKNGTANFGFIFNKTMTVRKSCFEMNPDFEKKRECGKGAFGEVHAFVDKKSQLSFVRKRFQKQSRFRKEEILSLIHLDHPGVVKLYALLCAGDTVDLLMQDAGHPLRSCLKMFYDKRIAPEKYWQVVEDLAKQGFEAGRYIHQQGICHLDVKPENLLVYQASNRGLVLVLTDFGSSVKLTQTMIFDLGLTPEYWAPELWHHVESHLHNLKMNKGSVQFSPQAGFDTYAMGLCVYYMCTHQHLMKHLEAQQKTGYPLVPPQEVDQFYHQFGVASEDFFFKFLLMKHNSHQIPQWAIEGSWLFPGIPDTLLTLIWRTLHHEPDERWTDEQASKFLSGEMEVSLPQEDEPDLKTPTQVEDNSHHSGQSEPDAAQQAPVFVDSVPRDAPPGQMDPPPEGIYISSGMQRYQQSISPFLMAWDQTAGNHTAGLPLGQTLVTNVAIPDSGHFMTQQDFAVGSYSQALTTEPPSAVNRGMLILRPPVVSNIDPQGYGDEGETGETSQVEQKTKPQTDAMDETEMKGQRDWEGGHPDQTRDWGGKTEDNFMNMVGNLEELTVYCQDTSVEPVLMKPPAAVGGKGKGRVKGKIGGKRRPVSAGLAGGKQRKKTDKVMASSAITKAKSPDKKVLRGKNLPLISSQLKKPVPQVPFLVASSSRPKPAARVMSGLPLTRRNPGSSVSEQAGGSVGLVRPPDEGYGFSQVQLGDDSGVLPHGNVQPQMEDLLLGENSLLLLTGLGCGSAVGSSVVPSVNAPFPPPSAGYHLHEGFSAGSSVASQLWQQPMAGYLEVAPLDTAGVVPSSFTKGAVDEPGTPVCTQSTVCGTGVGLEVMNQTGIEELLQLLDANMSQQELQNLVVGSELQEQVLGEGALAQHVFQGENLYMTDIGEISLSDGCMAVMNEGASMIIGCEADMDENISDAHGNVPDLAKLLDL